MATVKNISTDGTIAQKVGENIIVQTAAVPAREQFLTLVLVKGMPFDLAVSDTVEQAFKEHQAFIEAAQMIEGDVDGALKALERALLN